MGGRTARKVLAEMFLGTAAILGAVSPEVRGEEYNEYYGNNVSAELQAVNARLAALERQLQSQASVGVTNATQGCGADACGTNCDCACVDTCCCNSGWFAGVGAYVMAPHWTTNPALATGQVVGGVAQTAQTDFDYGLSAAPLVWFGFRGESCLGFETRAWFFHDADSTSLTHPGGAITFNSAGPLGVRNTSTTAGDVLSFASSLDMDVVDVLGSYLVEYRYGTLDFGMGLRYARVKQQYRHSEDPAANNLIDMVESDQSFEGIGPTLALRGRTVLTARWTAFADLRYSVLFGEHSQRAVGTTDNVINVLRTQSADDFLHVAEIELGAEYVVPRGNVELFLDGALVAQVWQGVGNSSNNDSIAVMVDPEVSDKNADLGMLGFRLGGGVRY